jgi:hypothetical protein
MGRLKSVFEADQAYSRLSLPSINRVLDESRLQARIDAPRIVLCDTKSAVE